MQSQMNLKIKYRESFRPFAPAVLAERVGEYFELDRPSPYMLIVAPVREELRKPLTKEEEALFGIEKLNVPRSSIPAVTHVDYSARVQTVHEETNPKFHSLLEAFSERTGSGVLAIAAAKIFNAPVRAGDIDRIAVASANTNARMNGVAHYVRPVWARGLRHPALQSGAPYDLVFANILARPLCRLAPSIKDVLAPGGEVILSGLLTCDVASVVSAYRSQQLALVERIDLDGWATLRMRRGTERSI